MLFPLSISRQDLELSVKIEKFARVLSTVLLDLQDVMEISDKNLSHVELTWTDPYGYVYDRPWLRFLMGLLVIVISGFGSVLVWGLVMFERFGGDPQKRGILNQVGVFCINLCLMKLKAT